LSALVQKDCRGLLAKQIREKGRAVFQPPQGRERGGKKGGDCRRARRGKKKGVLFPLSDKPEADHWKKRGKALRRDHVSFGSGREGKGRHAEKGRKKNGSGFFSISRPGLEDSTIVR